MLRTSRVSLSSQSGTQIVTWSETHSLLVSSSGTQTVTQLCYSGWSRDALNPVPSTAIMLWHLVDHRAAPSRLGLAKHVE